MTEDSRDKETAKGDDYVAYLRFRHTGERTWLKLCDSDAEGAFKVYRESALSTARRDGEAEHGAHVAKFLNELYATMIDPLADGEIKVSDMCERLLAQAREDREKLLKVYELEAEAAVLREALEKAKFVMDHFGDFLNGMDIVDEVAQETGVSNDEVDTAFQAVDAALSSTTAGADLLKRLETLEAERAAILDLLPEDATCKHPETGESLLDNIRDFLKRLENAERKARALDWYDKHNGAEPMKVWYLDKYRWRYMGQHYDTLLEAIKPPKRNPNE